MASRVRIDAIVVIVKNPKAVLISDSAVASNTSFSDITFAENGTKAAKIKNKMFSQLSTPSERLMK
jgi:hypothetical protein